MKHGGLAALLGIALAVSSEAGTQHDLARELPRIKPLEPAAALSSFRIHPEKVKRCQEPISGTLMQESRFSVPDTFFFTGHNHAGHARGGLCAASWDLADRNGHAITTKVGTTMDGLHGRDASMAAKACLKERMGDQAATVPLGEG